MRPTRTLLVIAMLVGVLTACTGKDEPVPPTSLSDPCRLVSDELLERLLPGGVRTPTESLGGVSGMKQCDVDLAISETAPVRAYLMIKVSVGGDGFGGAWRSKTCDGIQAELTTDGPGDVSCVRISDGEIDESRIEAWAWEGDDAEVWVLYRRFEPVPLPTDAERLVRDLLSAAVDSLPV